MTAGGSALHVTGARSAFIADLYDCLRDLTPPDASLVAVASGATGWAVVLDTLVLCPDLDTLLVGRRPPAATFAVTRAEPRQLPLRDAAVDAVLLGAAAAAPRRMRGVIDEAWRTLRPGGGVLIASSGAASSGRRLPLQHAVAWCRMLEEHGFSVEKTLTTRSAEWREASGGHAACGAPPCVSSTTRTRDGALSEHAWESLIIQARRW
ncbi:MAG TPA: methyltransferase domain-containing protein [Dehalococcoidia bacterium]|nr:methyltransferase domain-containing protein [Dehalococcoidia bacterium]